MKKDVDCLIFEDQLDALVDGGLPEEGLEQLRPTPFPAQIAPCC